MKRAPSISLPSLRHAAGRTSRSSCIAGHLAFALKCLCRLLEMTHRFGIHNNRLPMSLGGTVVI